MLDYSHARRPTKAISTCVRGLLSAAHGRTRRRSLTTGHFHILKQSRRLDPMKQLPETDNTLLLRTDFSDDSAWESLSAAIQRPVGEFRASVTPVSDPAFDGAPVEEVLERLAEESDHSFLFIADRFALTDPDHPVLVVDLIEQPGRTF